MSTWRDCQTAVACARLWHDLDLDIIFSPRTRCVCWQSLDFELISICNTSTCTCIPYCCCEPLQWCYIRRILPSTRLLLQQLAQSCKNNNKTKQKQTAKQHISGSVWGTSVKFAYKGPVMWNAFSYNDVIMTKMVDALHVKQNKYLPH